MKAVRFIILVCCFIPMAMADNYVKTCSLRVFSSDAGVKKCPKTIHMNFEDVSPQDGDDVWDPEYRDRVEFRIYASNYSEDEPDFGEKSPNLAFYGESGWMGLYFYYESDGPTILSPGTLWYADKECKIEKERREKFACIYACDFNSLSSNQ